MATTTLGIPLVDFDTDQPNGAGQINAVAEAVDNLIGGLTLGDSSPLTPDSNYASTSVAQYWRVGRVVYLGGMFAKNSGVNIANSTPVTLSGIGALPVACRPAVDRNIPCVRNDGGFGWLIVKTTGTIQLVLPSTAAANAVFVDGVSYVTGA